MTDSAYSQQQENKSIWVVLELDNGEFETVSLELLSKGRELADQMNWSLVGLLPGHHVLDQAELALAHGADEVYYLDHARLALFTIEAYIHAVQKVVLEEKPSVLLFGATPNGRDLAGRLAVRLRTGLNADCTQIRMDTARGVLVCEVSGFGGGVLALIEMEKHRPQMATVRTGVFEQSLPDFKRKGRLIPVPIEFPPDLTQTEILERVTGQQVNLAQAPVLVAGGRGIDGDFNMLRELANRVNGEVGATRPPVDEGHIERERQIGQTGVVCSPKVAVCCGISGAFHFIVGIEKAETVIAINSDPDAPIFEHADYNVIGDIHRIMPAVIEALDQVNRE
jgi:electron transfer flavoprotein alpha subunit